MHQGTGTPRRLKGSCLLAITLLPPPLLPTRCPYPRPWRSAHSCRLEFDSGCAPAPHRPLSPLSPSGSRPCASFHTRPRWLCLSTLTSRLTPLASPSLRVLRNPQSTRNPPPLRSRRSLHSCSSVPQRLRYFHGEDHPLHNRSSPNLPSSKRIPALRPLQWMARARVGNVSWTVL